MESQFLVKNSLEENIQVPMQNNDVISISEHKKILKNIKLKFYNARSRTQRYINHLHREFQESYEKNARQMKLLKNNMQIKLYNQSQMINKVSWEAQQSQYDLGILENELKNTQNLLNQKCVELGNSKNNMNLQYDISMLQDKLVESDRSLQDSYTEILNLKSKLSLSTSENKNAEIFKWKNEKKQLEKSIKNLKKDLNHMKEDKSSVEFLNETYIANINKLNDELRDYRIGNSNIRIKYGKEATCRSKVSNCENIQDKAENIDLNFLYEEPGYIRNDTENPLENYGFSDLTGQYCRTDY